MTPLPPGSTRRSSRILPLRSCQLFRPTSAPWATLAALLALPIAIVVLAPGVAQAQTPPALTADQKQEMKIHYERGQRAYDTVDLDPSRACLGRLYFKVPGGLQYGQHFLNIKFATTKVRVPFRIFTKDEEKVIQKNWKDIKKQVEEAFKKGRGK